MDLRYWIVVSGSESAALVSSSLPSDSRALRSETDMFATSARGSCGMDPGPVRLTMVILSASPMGDWLCGVRKRVVVILRSLMSSAYSMLRFTFWTV